MGKVKMLRTEKTTVEEYYNFPIEDILSDARLVLELGDEKDREIITIPIFYYSRSLKKQQAEEKYSCPEGRRKPRGNIEQKTRVTHLNVHRGGLYKPPAPEDEYTSANFKAWRKSQSPEVTV